VATWTWTAHRCGRWHWAETTSGVTQGVVHRARRTGDVLYSASSPQPFGDNGGRHVPFQFISWRTLTKGIFCPDQCTAHSQPVLGIGDG